MLAIITFVLQHMLPKTNDLQDIADILTEFLIQDMPLHRACALSTFESTDLQDWVWRRGLRDAESNRWTVAKLVHTNRHYFQWEFAEAMCESVRCGSVKKTQWMLDHFPGCAIPGSAVAEAAEYGRLAVLELFEAEQPHRIVEWAPSSMDEAARAGHWDLVHWLDERVPRSEAREISWVVKHAIEQNKVDEVKWGVENGFNAWDDFPCTTRFCGCDWENCSEIVRYLLEGGHGDRQYILHAGLQQAVQMGDLEYARWLTSQQRIAGDDADTGCRSISSDHLFNLRSASNAGHLHVVKWLLELVEGANGFSRALATAMRAAARAGKLEVMQWLYSQYSHNVYLYGTESRTDHGTIVDIAAEQGQLVVLVYLHLVAVETQEQNEEEECEWLRYTDRAIDRATANGHLEVVKWLHDNLFADCTTEAMDSAATKGFHIAGCPQTKRCACCRDKEPTSFFDSQRAILEYLNEHFDVGCTTEAMDGAAANGNLKMLQWLHGNTNAGCSTAAMDQAAAEGYLDVVKWLHEHRSEGCTAKAMENAAKGGHLDVVKWLYETRSEGDVLVSLRGAVDDRYFVTDNLSTVQWLLSRCPDVRILPLVCAALSRFCFEIALFLHAQLRDDEECDEAVIRKTKGILDVSCSMPMFSGLRNWIEETYPEYGVVFLCHVELLVPLLTKLLNQWFGAATFPASFLEAEIFCLKKGGDQANPLNYRPLALLNTDYKILTRALATRVSRTLAATIHKNQNGFVPDRNIHATIDLLSVAQKMASVDSDYRHALAVLLDFRKAYDSLDRKFLLDALIAQGYPPQFVKVVAALHAGTTVRFLANGSKSRKVDVTSGIRQGCPLAPLLFILALEPLYRKLDTTPELDGINIRTPSHNFTLHVAGYADDTAVYLRHHAEFAALRDLTNIFGNASGLRLNENKTLVVALHPDGPAREAFLPEGMRFMEKDESQRYLGLRAGSSVPVSRVWDIADCQLRTRLRLAMQKTMTVAQRSLVASAVIITKLLFLARHAWPTMEIIEQFARKIKNYVWHGCFTMEIQSHKAWLNADIAALPLAQGGLAVPELLVELKAMAAFTVQAWATSADPQTRAVGDLLFDQGAYPNVKTVYITPAAARDQRGPTFKSTMWLTGREVIAMAASPDVPEHGALVQAVHKELSASCTLTWTPSGLMINYAASTSPEALRLQRFYTKHYHGVCLEWLPYVDIRFLKLYDESGTVVNTTVVFRRFLRGSMVLLSDVVTWERLPDHHLVFHCIFWTRTLTSDQQLCFEYLIWLLITNFPMLALRPRRANELRLQIYPAECQLTATVTDTALSTVTVYAGGSITEQSKSTATTAAVLANVRRVLDPPGVVKGMHPHPWLSRLVCLWVGHRRWSRTRAQFKATVARSSRRRAKVESTKREISWKRTGGRIGVTITLLEWNRMRRIVGLNAWGEQLLLRVRHGALSTWDVNEQTLGCPHDSCARQFHVHLRHVMWDCPAARLLWSVFFTRWKQLGLKCPTGDDAMVFNFELPAVPSRVWRLADEYYPSLSERLRLAMQSTLYDVAAACWRLGVALYLHAVWRWRVEHFDEHNDVSAEYQQARLAARLQQGYRTVHLYMRDGNSDSAVARASSVMRHALSVPHHTTIPRGTANNGTFLLFFDGGSRGNPGPGGSGAIVLEAGTSVVDSRILWVASTSLAQTSTTNNRAEYVGLLTGLLTCHRHNWAPLHVVGDSQMIITQLRRRKPPRAAKLRALYWRCRTLADQLNVITWTHHLRSFNKMADALANQAMDTKRSVQTAPTWPTSTASPWSTVLEHLHLDLGHWLEKHISTGADAPVAGVL